MELQFLAIYYLIALKAMYTVLVSGKDYCIRLSFATLVSLVESDSKGRFNWAFE